MADTPVTITRVALCSVCGVHHPWTPERGWGCPRAVAPTDTVPGLAGRLRDAQTGLVMMALRMARLETEARRALDALHARVDAADALLRTAVETIAATQREVDRVVGERDAVIAASQETMRGMVASSAMEHDRLLALRDALAARLARAAEHTATMVHGEDCMTDHQCCGPAVLFTDGEDPGYRCTEGLTREACVEAQEEECECGLAALRRMLGGVK